MSESSKYEETLSELSKNISQLRKEKLLTQREVAFACGMEEQNYRRIEKGLTNPTLKSLVKISEVLKVELSDLLKPSKP